MAWLSYLIRRQSVELAPPAPKDPAPRVPSPMLECTEISPQTNSNRSRTWKSGPAFTEVFSANDINSNVFDKVVAPTFPLVMDGETCNFFAYGHSGSGKTHTIIGYNHEENQHLGLYLSTARDLFRAIDEIYATAPSRNSNRGSDPDELGIAARLYEVRGKCAYDLFNNAIECHVREGPDGQTHIRGETELLEGGKVRVRPIVARPCWSLAELRESVLRGLELRKVGSSTTHDESSRTHAILELEIVNRALLEARDAVIDRESELVPVGKRATDIYIEEQMKGLIQTSDGKYTPNPEYSIDQTRIDAAEAEKQEYEARVKAAEDAVGEIFRTRRHRCLGGKFVFVDLAGSEYFDQAVGTPATGPKQSPQEKKQGRQINTDLFALKEVIRARASNQARIPFRSSPLTMILRSHFVANGGQSAMILTVSPSETQFGATMNTLKYGNLMGAASDMTRK